MNTLITLSQSIGVVIENLQLAPDGNPNRKNLSLEKGMNPAIGLDVVSNARLREEPAGH